MIATERHGFQHLPLDDDEDLLVVGVPELPDEVLHRADDDPHAGSRHTFTLAELRSL